MNKMHKYEYRKSALCEFYGLNEAFGQKVDLHHIYSQNTINTLITKGTLDEQVGLMFRDSFANLYPLTHNQHIAKSPIAIATEYGSKTISFPQWTQREFYLLTQYFLTHFNELTILNFGYVWLDGVFDTSENVINSQILRETLSQVCIEALGYYPEWVKE